MITKEKTVLCVMDYQERIMPAIDAHEELVAKTVKLIRGARALGVDMVVTQQYTKGLGATIPEVREALQTDSYIEKLSFKAAGDIMKSIPEPEEKPYILLCGVESHVCLLLTALGLKEAGYSPVLVADAVGSRNRQDKKIALMRAMCEGVTVSTVETVLFELLERAGTDVFKTVSAIVK